jgi:hypothetical protein
MSSSHTILSDAETDTGFSRVFCTIPEKQKAEAAFLAGKHTTGVSGDQRQFLRDCYSHAS